MSAQIALCTWADITDTNSKSEIGGVPKFEVHWPKSMKILADAWDIHANLALTKMNFPSIFNTNQMVLELVTYIDLGLCIYISAVSALYVLTFQLCQPYV